MKLENLRELYVEQLRDLHSCEQQITKALPKMSKAAQADELKAAFDEHLEETRQHVSRLETILDELGVKPTGEKCDAMDGIIEEGDHIITVGANSSVRDAALICAAQKVEHYEMGSYGCVCSYARLLGEPRAADLLNETLNEERACDQRLTTLADQFINEHAMMA